MLAALEALKEAGVLDRAEIRIVLSGDEKRIGSQSKQTRRDMINAARLSDLAL